MTGFYTPESLATELKQTLNSTARKQVTPLHEVIYSAMKGEIEITCPVAGNETFTFLITQCLMDNTYLNDAGRPLGFTAGPPLVGQEISTTIRSPQAVNLQPYSQMFIRGDLGVPFASFGPRGEGNILRRIVVTAPSNSMNYDAHVSHYDNIIVGPGSYNNFKFKLTSWDGK